ncbi:hypothetical protein CRG98_043341 [Punica granatum]|uniref:DNA-binding domain-containing protein n=1 Tax=Punica granatum TaxID=22663 RepID=A0A2I0HX27_PUNGR|nr:hypothetical protein CRG98_043341 [Punica granatum]
MANPRFKLSDMVPNAWFYKLKDMNRTPKKSSKPKPKPNPAAPSPPVKPATYNSSASFSCLVYIGSVLIKWVSEQELEQLLYY